MLILSGCHGYKEKVSDVLFNLLQENVCFYVLTIKKLFASLFYSLTIYNAKMVINMSTFEIPNMGVWKTNINYYTSFKVIILQIMLKTLKTKIVCQ